MTISSHQPKDHACKPHTSKLCIRLLDVAQWGHELLAWDWLTIVQQVTLGKQSQLIGQNIGIGSDASDAACHITTRHTRITYMMQSHRISFLLRCTSMHISSQPCTKLHTIFSSVYSFFHRSSRFTPRWAKPPKTEPLGTTEEVTGWMPFLLLKFSQHWRELKALVSNRESHPLDLSLSWPTKWRLSERTSHTTCSI